MRQPKPLPTSTPFLTIYTSTHLRPTALVRNMASVGRQSMVEHVEQIVLPDHVGYGLAGGLFGRIPWYAAACRGAYVAILSDDDVLATDNAVAQLARVAQRHDSPAVIAVDVLKQGSVFPKSHTQDRPVEGDIDLGSYVLRRDVWLEFADRYGMRYSGDVDHAQAWWDAGHRPVYADFVFASGPLGNGVSEVSL
jgi:hypothetical protein